MYLKSNSKKTDITVDLGLLTFDPSTGFLQNRIATIQNLNSIYCMENLSMHWNIYLSGEIHTDWREQIIKGCQSLELPTHFTSAVTHHESSDAAGDVLGKESSPFWRDHKSAKVNAIRTQTLLKGCDLAIIRFGQQYKQWNAAFDAGYCAALGIPYITLHDENIIHPLKEVDAGALAWATTIEQVIDIIRYVVAE